MASRLFMCDESRLKSFLDDGLPEIEHAQLAGHLDTCAGCRRTLERLAAGSRLWADLRRLAPTPGLRPTGGDNDTETYASERGPSFDREHSLDFLAPPSTTGSLGRLGPYEVSEVLGQGGFGIVFKAFDPALGRTVAVKVLAAQLATSAGARKRFAREAKAAAAVVHDHVVAIHAVESWNGLPYLVMPYIAGRSLQDRVDREGPLEVREVLRIGIQTALGLAAAHAQGLVHRDVKPSNILLENGVERVKLTDFGLARAIDDASLTQSGVVAGTPQYMSPEQARGEAVDHRSDLFSLGSVLYFACAGHSPFRADSTPAVLRRVCDERPRPLRELDLDVPGWLAEIVERLHAKEPAGRYQSAQEVAEVMGRRLASLQRGEPLKMAGPRAPNPKLEKIRLGRKTIAASLLCATVLGFAVIPQGGLGRITALLPLIAQKDSGDAKKPPTGKSKRTVDEERTNITYISTGSSEAPIVGSGNPAVKTWDVAGFTSVSIGSTFRAEVTRGDEFKVSTSCDDNVIPHLRVTKEGTTLKIGLERGKSYQLKSHLKAEITLPKLAGLETHGASKCTLKGFYSQEPFRLNVSGASHVDGTIDVGDVDFDVSGASSLALTGSGGAARLTGSGASRYKIAEFPVKKCALELSGASSAQITSRSAQPFKAELSGASSLKGSVEAADFELELSGASHAELGGSAKSAKLKVDGTSHADLAELNARDLDVKLSGVSHARVHATTSLKYDLNSLSKLQYSGNPATVKGRKSGGATISRQQ
jgi:eukaryotic-like serine/threonine-protein kinase